MKVGKSRTSMSIAAVDVSTTTISIITGVLVHPTVPELKKSICCSSSPAGRARFCSPHRYLPRTGLCVLLSSCCWRTPPWTDSYSGRICSFETFVAGTKFLFRPSRSVTGWHMKWAEVCNLWVLVYRQKTNPCRSTGDFSTKEDHK